MGIGVVRGADTSELRIRFILLTLIDDEAGDGVPARKGETAGVDPGESEGDETVPDGKG